MRHARDSARRLLPALSLLAPSALVLLAFTYWPLAQALWRSAITQHFGGSATIGLDNYARLFSDPHFATAARNNALYAIFTILPALALASRSRSRSSTAPASPLPCAPSSCCR